jgi:hypothetical protein
MISFKDLKRQVGIDDVAFHLGYQLNRHAGVGKYIELVLPDARGGKLDAIIISHPREKEMQRYFHRNGSSKGDVVDFISENLYRFNKVGRNQWEVIGKVMADFANMPVIDNREYANSLGAISQNFNPKRYVGEPIASNADYALGILKERGLSQKTIDLFSSHISIVRDTQNKYGLPMIGFPYRDPGNDKIVGYELRGDRGFKGKAAGTNSTTAMWVAGIPSSLNNPENVNRVYFCESAYDAMAFYQANRAKIDLARSAFVSVGGALSNRQVSGVMNHFSLAKAVDCFDNDLAGRVYGMRMAGTVDGMRLGVVQVGDKLQIKADDRQIEMDIGKANAVVLSKQLGLSGRTEMWKPPMNYKDWNDVVRGMPLEALQLKTKFQRDENLSRIRQEMRERNEQKRGFHR